MRVRTIVATADTAYTRHISEYISEFHSDTIEINVCNDGSQLEKTLGVRQYDIALIDQELIGGADLGSVELPMLLRADGKTGDVPGVKGYINKHKRISLIISDILEQYASVAGNTYISDERSGGITAVWSPGGGAGTTTVALAYAMMKTSEEKDVFYLNLEAFASTHAFFGKSGKSISAVFEMLESNKGNAGMLISGIHSCENGIKYLCAPDNFDDICVLSPENVRELVSRCAAAASELVIDLTCVCDARTRKVFDLADKVLLVTDSTGTAMTKLMQFASQSNVYEVIREKATLVVNNKAIDSRSGAVAEITGGRDKIFENAPDDVVYLPHIKASDASFIYKSLAKRYFWQRGMV